MANSIEYCLEAIKRAVYGRDVRDAIHDSIEACYADVTRGVSRAESVANSASTAIANAESYAAAALNTATQASTTLSDRISAFDTLVNQKIAAYDSTISAKVSSVDSVITQATNAKNAAETATTNATNAANGINNLTVSYINVGPNEEGSAIMREINGHRDIYFRLRQGAKGDSMVVKGSAYASIAALKAAVANPTVGDMYNVGASAPYTIYRWTGDTSVGSDGWESQGTFGSTIAAVTTSEIDTLWSGSTVSGDTKYLDRSGLSYLIINKILSALGNKVDKENNKGLISAADQTKLNGIATGAEVNVQSDWNVTDPDSDAFIKNKPTIPSGVVVDSALDGTSVNPVQNRIVKAAIDDLAGRFIKITDSSALHFTSVTWSASSDSDFPYYTDLTLTGSGITANHFVDVVFSPGDAISGVYSPMCESRSGGVVRIWATTNTNTTIDLKTVTAWR